MILLGIRQLLAEHFPGLIILLLLTEGNHPLQIPCHLIFGIQVILQHLRHRPAHAQRRPFAQIRGAAEKENTLNNGLGMSFLVIKLVGNTLVEPGQPPVRVHLGMDEVLVHGGQ